jgi:tRNA (guanine-N7-)-methyltransferase
MTPTQLRGLEDGWSEYGLSVPTGAFDFVEIFDGREVALDIGFGMGESVLTMAIAQPQRGILGVEVHDRGVGQVLAGVIDLKLRNVRVVRADAADMLRDHIGEQSLSEVRLYFPDPWPKSRHHKRRLVQPEWSALVASRLKRGGRLHCATDWSAYATHMRLVLDAEPRFERRDDLVAHYRAARPTTRYETIGIDRGHIVTDLVYERVS